MSKSAMTFDLLISGGSVGIFEPGETEVCNVVSSAQLPVSLDALQAALSPYHAEDLGDAHCGHYLAVPRQLLIDLGVIRES